MKKHLSLFLALLLLFSALLAFPAEAVQPEPMQEDTMVSTRQEIQAPRATDLYGTGDSVMVVPGDSSCSHIYKYTPRSASLHGKCCTKCGYTVVCSHTSFRVIGFSSTQHYLFCGNCGDFTLSHIKKYTPCNSTYHQIYCSVCSWSDIDTHTLIVKNGVCQCKYCKYRVN